MKPYTRTARHHGPISRSLRCHRLIAHPCEGVFGLACLPHHHRIRQHLRRLKQRRTGQGFILLADHWTRLRPWLKAVPRNILETPASRGINWILPASRLAPADLCGPGHTLAVRVSSFPLIQQLCRRVHAPLVSTSANRRGATALTRSHQIRKHFRHRIAAVLMRPTQGQIGPCPIYNPHTQRWLRPPPPTTH